MNQFRNLIFSDPTEFQITRPSSCPYLDGRTEQRLATDLSRHPEKHDVLARAGFRRVENWVYKPVCQGCRECLPIRIPAGNGVDGDLRLSRNQKRVMARNSDLGRRILPNFSRDDHYELFRQYLASRHADGQMAEMDEDSYTAMIASSPIETVLVEYRAEDRLIGVILIDIQDDGLSAVYSFFDPGEDHRSPGTFMVLDAAALAWEMGLDHLYLGYYIAASQKMTYKARFAPAEVLVAGRWTPLGN
ncbi:arginyltransferase [Alphaproteobacteria bacterium LSUCC0684]